ncbi:heme biosynthesis HemY N-terminal domain-containing protein [Pseudomonas oryzihabitans]|uniref:heme biosynthesis HemY N-terminal domain-containing protein n=1 Tax=Pseudomonas oryzihabitans TaxID=47885 RepID=UPI00285DC70D|nr:heme biosynthesis HemY N-terminal domain-containing protein [Pseudomonas psychrotolerans]MDR6677146.1 HemY protein [Pseudomonas psychrotolerans]
MKRLYLLFLFALLVGLGVAVVLAKEPGYVLLSYSNFRYESSLWAFLALLVAVWLALYILKLVLNALGLTGKVLNPWSRHNRQRRLEQARHKGQLELAEGNWSSALKHLKSAAEQADQPLFVLLGAARAANELGDLEERDRLLRQAREREPHAELAIGLQQARLQIDRGQYLEARDSLAPLQAKYPKNGEVLLQLQRLQVTLRDWPALIALLPQLRKQQVLRPQEQDDLERKVWIATLDEVPAQGAESALDAQWQQVPTALKGDSSVVLAYARQLRAIGRDDLAEEVLHITLNRQWDERLVELYGHLRPRDASRPLHHAEGWLRDRPQDPVLLLALGRLCMSNQLWGKAREYLETSLAQRPSAVTAGELARVVMQLGDVTRSQQLLQSQWNEPAPGALPATRA